MRLASDPGLKVEYVSTGLLPMDILLQGGIARGRFVEVYGDWSTLKSYVALMTIAQFQKRGETCAVIDTERTFDPEWAEEIGVDNEKLLVWPPRDDDSPIYTGEQSIDVTQALVRAGVSFVVFDSVAAILPQQEAAKRLHDESMQPGRQAYLMSAGLRRITASNYKTAILFINQTRQSIGITFGNPETVPGGKALGFYASARVRMTKAGFNTVEHKVYTGDKYQAGKRKVGQKFKAEVVKSKLSRPHGDVMFDWDLNTSAIDVVGFCFNQGVEHGLIAQRGSTWEYDGVSVRGKDNFKDRLRSDPRMAAKLENDIRKHYGLPILGSGGNRGGRVKKKALLLKRG